MAIAVKQAIACASATRFRMFWPAAQSCCVMLTVYLPVLEKTSNLAKYNPSAALPRKKKHPVVCTTGCGRKWLVVRQGVLIPQLGY